ncbi:glycosyltransferase [Arthrobacter sp. ISL-28]|uniref:glycosyltransferase n=1 Tax=Arthrobacter sp. ISL-28 TaxID=2819108 RepID=UPI001BEC3B52|nr:glycosyltransferase [Arthrobacter sp. ISL-28]MBT2519672.1 glycosyltransferase [Arthrobacter sp. ISL-28]
MQDKNGAICLAVYKPDLALLEKQIASIAGQTVADWTCIIGIDGTDTATAEHIRRLAEHDSRFVVHEFGNRVGFYRNFERILCLVPPAAQWVALSDQDDFWYEEKLNVLLDHLDNASLVSGQARIVGTRLAGEDQKVLGETSRGFFNVEELLLDNVISGALAVFRSDLLQIALPFPAATDVAYHDHWLGLCAALDKGILTVPDVVQDYHQHGANVIGEEMDRNPLLRAVKLWRRSAGITAAAHYVVNHRWQWRVNMCRLALERLDAVPPREGEVLEAFASGRSTPRLALLCARAFVRGRCSRMRVAAILVASVLAPALKEFTVEA